MKYVGIHTQQSRNNLRSAVLLFLFPCLVLLLTYLFSFLLVKVSASPEVSELPTGSPFQEALYLFLGVAPYVCGGVLIWFLIAYFFNTSIICSATGSHPLERKENKRIYNLVENLCISQGMKMPQVNIIEDDSLNAFASGINERTFTVSLSRGIIRKLDDEELKGVIAHELTHIRNRDVRLLIISIVFVGIFAMVAQIAMRSLYYSSFSGGDRDKKNNTQLLMLLIGVVALLGYFFSMLMRFAISRNREYMADAGAAEMTKNPAALASALCKISNDPDIEAVTRDDVAQLFIEHPHHKETQQAFSGLSGLFATHPPIKKRIQILEQF